MGVTGLWQLLNDLGKSSSLKDLPKFGISKVAVDLSVWILQSQVRSLVYCNSIAFITPICSSLKLLMSMVSERATP